MIPNLQSGSLYFKGEFLDKAIPEIPPLHINHPPEYVTNLTFPLSVETEFTMESDINIPTLNRMVGGFDVSSFPDATSFTVVYSKPYSEQVRRHKKKRINKKWAKRYGYVTKYKKYCIDEVHFRNDTADGEYEFYTNDIRRMKGE